MRTKLITFTTMIYNFIWSVGKVLFGIFMSAYIYILSGAYTFLLGFVKRIFLKNHKESENINKETKSIIMGVLILIAGFAFSLYMGSLAFWPHEARYGLIWSIFLALCSFVEMGIAIFNLCRVKKKNDILLSSLRCCNFVSACFAIVITQVAILSATETFNVSKYNAITGTIAGLIAICIGTYIIIKACKQKQITDSSNSTNPPSSTDSSNTTDQK